MDLKSIVVWWEKKRLVYNLVMLVAGTLGLILANLDITWDQLIMASCGMESERTCSTQPVP